MANNSNFLPYIAVANPLPDANTTVKAAYDLAFPQILTYCSALVGVLAVVMVAKSFIKGG